MNILMGYAAIEVNLIYWTQEPTTTCQFMQEKISAQRKAGSTILQNSSFKSGFLFEKQRK